MMEGDAPGDVFQMLSSDHEPAKALNLVSLAETHTNTYIRTYRTLMENTAIVEQRSAHPRRPRTYIRICSVLAERRAPPKFNPPSPKKSGTLPFCAHHGSSATRIWRAGVTPVQALGPHAVVLFALECWRRPLWIEGFQASIIVLARSFEYGLFCCARLTGGPEVSFVGPREGFEIGAY
ncbi:hypothetical protein IQ07DRAFT_120965 [Pyrenochaeta sp. DS3sAY3a]|nr:hypothetical protein IQ07DRAFT_120965 [Pyrenochaeta sp. DS3sAY3a]